MTHDVRKNVVGPKIREARLGGYERLSQEQLAARVQAMGVDLDQGILSRIESGERQVTDIEILAICEALGISVTDLFAGVRLSRGV